MRPRIAHALLAGLALLALAAPTALAQPERRCFAESDYCIEGRIREFWEQNGGLPVFGLPITPQQQERVEGRGLTVQWFERNRLELHPGQPRPYDVQIGRVGVDALAAAGRDWRSSPTAQPGPGCVTFAETGHTLCEPFLSYWRSYGLEFDGRAGSSEAESLALFGLPVSAPRSETLSDGRSYRVQWFERARFELHPENRPPFDLLLGRLGSELRGRAAPVVQLTPVPTSTPPPTPTRRRPDPEPEPASTAAPTARPTARPTATLIPYP